MTGEELLLLFGIGVYIVVARKLGARSRFERSVELIRSMNDALEEVKEFEEEEAAHAASKLAKDSGASTEEAARLVEESRDSAVEEGKKQQRWAWLLIVIFVILFLTGLDPIADISCYYDDAGEYVCQP